MTKAEEEIIELKFKGVTDTIEAGFRELKIELGHIKEQTTRTNGRVNKLEDITVFDIYTRLNKIERSQGRTAGIYAGVSGVIGVLVTILTLYFTSK